MPAPALHFVGDITLLVLCAGIFSVYLGVGLDLSLQLSAFLTLSLELGISIPFPPELLLELAAAADLLIGLGIAGALGINMPAIGVSVSASLSAQLTIVLGFVAALQAVLSVCLGAGVEAQAFTYVGASLGADLGAALASGWPDATPPSSTVNAIILAATSAGSTPPGSVAKVTVLGGGQGYAAGLCNVTFTAPPGGTAATGTVTLSTITLPPEQGGGTTKSVTAVNVASGGSGYGSTPPMYAPATQSPPTFTISDSTPVLGASNASPIVLTIADATDVTQLTVANVDGNTAANGSWCGKVLDAVHVALFEDSALTVPSVGNGAWTGGGTATGVGLGAAAVAVMGGGAVAQVKGFFDGLEFPSSGLSAGVSIGFSDMIGAGFELMGKLLANLDLQAKLLASASAKISVVWPTIVASIQIVTQFKAKIQALIDAGISFPLPSVTAKISAGIGAQIAAVADLVAGIGIQLGFATEELGVWTYQGPGSGLGPAITAAFPVSEATCVVLAATTPACSAAFSALFAGA